MTVDREIEVWIYVGALLTILGVFIGIRIYYLGKKSSEQTNVLIYARLESLENKNESQNKRLSNLEHQPSKAPFVDKLPDKKIIEKFSDVTDNHDPHSVIEVLRSILQINGLSEETELPSISK